MTNETQTHQALTALSPLDGRYRSKVAELAHFLSEQGLIYYRIFVELRWLEALASHDKITEISPFTEDEKQFVEAILANFDGTEAAKVKAHEQVTNHDVKAIEYYLKEKLGEHETLAQKREFIHFACTSEDINNLSYSLMMTGALRDALIPHLTNIREHLVEMAHAHAGTPMLSRTHGQSASPTTMGKELANVVDRLQRQITCITDIHLGGKINGAVGNYNAHHVAYPEVNWPEFSKSFVTDSLKLSWLPYTTQIEPHDQIAEVSHALMRANTILIDFCRDVWSYISLGYFSLKVIETETGSSTMPHKVNPIDFENAEGNFGLGNAMLEHLASKLPISRWQRDLTDSTVLRNVGSAFGYCTLALNSLEKGLGKVQVNTEKLAADLDDNWEVLGEAIQTVMRRYGLPQPYEQLKAYTRGKSIDQAMLHEFIRALEIPEQAKSALLSLKPSTYTGYAESLADNI